MRTSKPLLFGLLMGLSALLLVLPSPWSSWMRGLTQPITWLEWPIAALGRSIRSVASASPTDLARLREENEALRRAVGHQSISLAEKDRTIRDLSGIRADVPVEAGRIIVAAVVAGPAAPRRDWITVSAGSLDGVAVGNWVAAGQSAGPPQDDSGRQRLHRQWLIGQVSSVSPHVCTVRLATDPEFGPARVRLARPVESGEWELSPREELLYGGTDGRMRVRSAETDYYAQGFRYVVASVRGGAHLSLAVGRITMGRPAAQSALHFDLSVEPLGSARELSQVYVLVWQR